MDPRGERVELDPEDRRLVDRLVVLLRTAKAVSVAHELRQRLEASASSTRSPGRSPGRAARVR